MTETTQPAGRSSAWTVSRVYDGEDNVTKLTYPDGTAFHYAFDALNRLTAVQNAAKTNLVSPQLGFPEPPRPQRSPERRPQHLRLRRGRTAQHPHPQGQRHGDDLAPLVGLYPGTLSARSPR